ncbi:WAT1-related protein [Acorus calamus]|uniref:WAT1-related protein n=1 Tax=Acorus calamus TaxID=4465 RepID=A0AAV9EB86_ACOCL|nr:WAT1-related protein [Acorus calamus]
MYLLMQGVVTTPLTLIVMSWCIQKKGPLFTSIFNPLTLVVVDILGSIFLNEKLHLGRFVFTMFDGLCI